MHFKGNTTIKQILMQPKDSKSGLIYRYQCPQLDCDEEYIGETGRTLGERRKEHLKQPSPIHWYSQATGTPHRQQQLQHHRKGGLGAGKNHKRVYLHNGKQPHLKPKYWQVQPQSYRGQSSF